MNKLFSPKRITVTAVCIALCSILPPAFHSLGLGSALSPMHIPVLLCGMVCGWACGLICGIAGPILSSLLTGMPGTTMLVSMVPELMAYGLCTGLLMQLVHTKKLYADLYISLAGAMILGRIVGGIAKALFYMGTGTPFSLALWVSSYFTGSIPGIVCHLILIPLLVITLTKARLIPVRYPKEPVHE